jgi:N-acetylneuraminic acid mutarotase
LEDKGEICLRRFKLLAMVVLIVVMALSMVVPAFAAGDSWVLKADLPSNRGLQQLVGVGDRLYAFGGRDDNTQNFDSLYEYNTLTNSWTLKSNMPYSSSYASSTVLNGKIYLIGGQNTSTDGSKTVYEYDPVANSWTLKAPLTAGRITISSVTLNGKVYAIGGYNSKNVDEYDPSTNTWVTKAELLYPTGYSSAAVANGKIYVFGGYLTNNYVQVYDPVTNTWALKNPLPSNSSPYGHKVLEYNGKIYKLGGSGFGKSFQEYNPDTDTWVDKANMNISRMNFGATILNGTIYVAGGIDPNYYMKSVEAYTLQSVVNAPSALIANAGNSQVTLTWSGVTGATGYNIKRSTTAGGPYTTVASNVYGSPYTDTTVTNGTTYYYVVTAINAGGESGNSNEASATPQGTVTPPTGNNRALLVITLVSGLEKEYDLSMSEVNNFTTWYAARAAGTGAEVYTINKSFNKASFLSRKDNIAFNKIELYEINEYTPAP